MALKLMYITNSPEIAKIAQAAGVDRIWIDLEYIGKEERQKGLNTVKSHHSISDINLIKPVLTTSELLVRVNPIHDGSRKEIENVISAGAKYIMLPMFKTSLEVKTFLSFVNKRAKTILLIETKEALEIIDEILSIDGVDEYHIGLNDLSLSLHKPFMFDLLRDGIVDYLISKIKNTNKPFGFGGIARLGYGLVPSENIIMEHYRLGSTRAILSRSFCNANTSTNLDEIKPLFMEGVKAIRLFEKQCSQFSMKVLLKNHEITKELIDNADKRITSK